MNATAERPDWPDWVETWILPYISDPTLWPVLFALLGHVVVLIAPLMLFVYRHGSLNSLVVLTALAIGSAALIRFEIRVRSRPGGVSLVVFLIWSTSASIAWLSDYYGVF